MRLVDGRRRGRGVPEALIGAGVGIKMGACVGYVVIFFVYSLGFCAR